MAGRKRKNSQSVEGHRTKDEMGKKAQSEKLAGGFKGLSFAPPAWLDKEAKREYRRVVPALQNLQITALDRTSVALYCNSYSKYLIASKDVDEHGLFLHGEDADGNQFIDTKKKNPAISVMTDMSREVRSFASSLGMTLDSRMKLVAPSSKNEEEADPFATKYGGLS